MTASEVVDLCEAEHDCGGIRAIKRGDISCFAYENEVNKRYRVRWIEELEVKIALCGEDGWEPLTPQEARDWVLSMWPDYTPKKEYEQKIYELQKELGISPTVPRHINLCPVTTDQAKNVIAKFEELAAK